MATILDTVVIKITSDATEVKKTTDILLEQGKVEKKNVAIFEAAAKKRQVLLDANIKRLDKLRIQRKKAFNPQDIRRFDDLIARTTKDVEILGGKMDKLDKKSGFLNTTFGKIGATVLGAFAVSKLINFSEHLFEVAVESEAFQKRAKTVFGSSAKFVEEFAEETAESLGLTIDGFLGAAAAIGDILVPLGISRERAAEMSTELTQLGGALKEFTGDSRSAAEISNIVARSLTGEVEGLKTLGLVIDQTSIQFKDLVKSKQIDLGLTRQQAKAEAIFQTAIEGSADALKQFETNTDSLARQQSIASAKSSELTESLARSLAPAFLTLSKATNVALGKLLNFIKIPVSQKLEEERQAVNLLVFRITDVNVEQDERNRLINELQSEYPDFLENLNAETVTNEQLALRLKEVNEQLVNKIVIQRKTEAIQEQAEKTADKLEAQLEAETKLREELIRINEKFTLGVEFTNKTLSESVALVQKALLPSIKQLSESRKTGIITLNKEGKANQRISADLLRLNIAQKELNESNNLGNALLGEKNDLLKSLGIVQEEVTGDQEENNESTKEQIRNIFLLKNAISVLRKEQTAQTTSTQRISQINKELIPLQKELNQLLGKGQAVDIVSTLTKNISELRKELINQALAGDINRETVDELNEALERLEQAQLRVKGAIKGTLEFMGAQKLELLEIKDIVLDVAEEQARLAKIEEERIATLRDKRLEAIALVEAAEQQAFSVLRGINDRKLILIDNEQIAEERKLDAKFEQGRLTEEQLFAAQLKIQTEADKKRAEILTKQAKQDKLAAIISATINTAIAVTRALATGNVVLAAFVALLGAAQIATIASQPIPTFHEGKKAELKPGEMNAVILKSESVIPPKPSKEHKGLIDSMIEGKLENYVFQKYQLPLIRKMGKDMPYDDRMFDDENITRKQGKTNQLLEENNKLLKQLKPSMNRQSYGWR